MGTNIVQDWFQEKYLELDPLIQRLHAHGGTLSGTVQINFGKGLAGIFGKTLARKLNIPLKTRSPLTVYISHHDDGIHWDRQFGDGNRMNSIFTPSGTMSAGYWTEKTGLVTMKLTVDVVDGGWYWRPMDYQLYGVPIPKWALPKTKAYKRIENGRYRFCVEISVPLLGPVVGYSGLLDVS